MQLSDEAHQNLHDIVCCWLWLRKHMVNAYPGELVAQHDTLFANGFPGWMWFIAKSFWLGVICCQMVLAGRDSLPNGFGLLWFVAKWFWLGVIRCQMVLAGCDSLPNGFGWAWFVAKWFWLSVIRCQMVLARCDWVSRNHVMASQTDLAKEN